VKAGIQNWDDAKPCFWIPAFAGTVCPEGRSSLHQGNFSHTLYGILLESGTSENGRGKAFAKGGVEERKWNLRQEWKMK
jgi:hypothetical protein